MKIHNQLFFLDIHYTLCFYPRIPCSFSGSLSLHISPFHSFFFFQDSSFSAAPFMLVLTRARPSLSSILFFFFLSLSGFYFTLSHGFNLHACDSKFTTLLQIVQLISRPLQPIVSLPFFLDSPQAFQTQQILPLPLPATFPSSCVASSSEQHHYVFICPGQKLGYHLWLVSLLLPPIQSPVESTFQIPLPLPEFRSAAAQW